MAIINTSKIRLNYHTTNKNEIICLFFDDMTLILNGIHAFWCEIISGKVFQKYVLISKFQTPSIYKLANHCLYKMSTPSVKKIILSKI